MFIIIIIIIYYHFLTGLQRPQKYDQTINSLSINIYLMIINIEVSRTNLTYRLQSLSGAFSPLMPGWSLVWPDGRAFTDICKITVALRTINICTKFLQPAELDGMRRNYSVGINFDRSALFCFLIYLLIVWWISQMLGKIAGMSTVDWLSLSCYKRSKKIPAVYKDIDQNDNNEGDEDGYGNINPAKICLSRRDKRFVFVYIFVLTSLVCKMRGDRGLGGRNDARKFNDIIILTNKILIVGGRQFLPIITLFAPATNHHSDFRQ